MLQRREFSTRHLPSGRAVTVRSIAPSEHVPRDLALDATFAVFEKTDQRGEADRELEPEFVDSPLFQDRASVLMSGRLVPRFLLEGARLAAGDRVRASLAGGRLLEGVLIQRAFFAAAGTGLARTEEAHAGDFIFEGDHANVASQRAGYFVSRHWCSASLCPMAWHADDGVAVEVLDLSRLEAVIAGPEHAAGGSVPEEAPDHLPSSSRARRTMRDANAAETHPVVSLWFCSDGSGTQSGKEVTLSGFYMSYISWLLKDLCRSHPARTVAATTAGVD